MSEYIDQFHFIRPLWMLGFLILPLLWLYLGRASSIKSDWNKVIDSDLLRHLTPSNTTDKNTKPTILVCLLLGFIFTSLAGPSWQKKPSPVIQTGDDLVIILDLSLSVLATDVAPDRLTKANKNFRIF